jgi:lambda family phage tail tape measure protein
VPTQNEYDIQIRLIVDQGIAEVEKLKTLINNVDKNTSLETLTNKFKQLTAQVTIAIAELRKVQEASFGTGTAMGKAGAPATVTEPVFASSLKAAEGIKTLSTAVNSMNTQFNNSKAVIGNFQTQGRKFSGLLDEWWHRFGSVAIAFTVVYRAMNALEAGVGQLANMIKKAILVSGELAAEQAKLALFASMGSKGVIKIADAFDQASGTIVALHDASVTSLSSLEDLTVGLDKLGQANIFPKPEQMKNFADFIDLTILVSKTTGNTAMQVRSEVQALLTGQMRANNVLVNMLKSMGVLSEQDIQNLKKMTDRAQILEKVLTLVGISWDQVLKKITISSPEMAMAVWEKGIVRVMTRVIQMVSQKEGTQNIFGQVIYEHLTKWNEQFKNLANNEDAKAMAVMMMKLRDALDFALTAFERMVVVVADLFVIYKNAEQPIKTVLQLFLTYELIRFAGSILNSIARSMGLLATAATAATASVTPFLLSMAGVVLAVITLNAALKTLVEGHYLEKLTKSLEESGHPFFAIAIATIDLQLRRITIIQKWIEDKTKELAIYTTGVGGTARIVSPMYTIERPYPEQAGRKLQTGPIQAQMAETQGIMDEFMKNIRDQIGGLADVVFMPLKWAWDKLIAQGFHLPPLTFTKGGIKGVEGEKTPAEDSLETLIKLAGSLSTSFTQMAKTGVKDATVSMEQFRTILKGLGMEITTKFGEIQVRRDAINQLLDKTDAELRKKGITKLQLRMELIGLDQSEDDLRRLKASIQDVSHAYVDMRTAAGEAETGKGSQYEMQKAYNLLLHDTANQVVLIQDRYIQGTQDYNNAMRDLLTNVLPQITTYQFIDPDYIKDQDTITKNYRKMVNDARDWKGAIAEGFKVVGDIKVFDTLRDIVVNAFQGMTDAIVDFVDTGKINFHDMAMSMLKDLLRLEIQLQVMKPMAAWMGGMWEGVFPAAKPYASGGIIEEHIIGMGKSGKRYEFGEQGPEMVTPLGSSSQSSAPTEVHIHNAPQGTTVQETTTSRGGKKIDIMIDEIVSRKLAGGSSSQNTLRSVYGLRPALVGR